MYIPLHERNVSYRDYYEEVFPRQDNTFTTVSAAEATPTQPQSTVDQVINLTPPIQALIAVVVVLSVLIVLGFVLWRVKVRRNRNKRALSEGKDSVKCLDVEVCDLEKPKAVFTLAPPAPFQLTPHTGWVPHIRTYRGDPVDGNPFTTKKESSPSSVPESSYTSEKIVFPSPPPLPTSGTKGKKLLALNTPATPFSPPPSYFIANGRPLTADLQSTASPPPPFSRPNSGEPRDADDSEAQVITIMSDTTAVDHPTAIPLPSPARFASFASQANNSPTSPTQPKSKSRGFPRLMTVIKTFTRTLDDELEITPGDLVRLIEEYEDDWCLVQHVGKIDSPKGVVPRFCIGERQGFSLSPTQKNLIKRMQGNLKPF